VDGALQILFLGLGVDSHACVLSIPPDKVAAAITLFREFISAKRVTITDLQRVLGKQNWMCAVIPAGKTFMGRLLAFLRHQNTLRKAKRRSKRRHSFRVGKEARKDIEWWIHALESLPARAFFRETLPERDIDCHIECDASARAGGAVYNGEWLLHAWSPSDLRIARTASGELNIAMLELLILVMCVATWGHEWSGKRVHFHSDSKATVDAINNRLTRNAVLLHLLRALHYEEARGGFLVTVEHIAGKRNTIADALSRMSMKRFMKEYKLRYGRDPPEEMRRAVYPQYNVHLVYSLRVPISGVRFYRDCPTAVRDWCWKAASRARATMSAVPNERASPRKPNMLRCGAVALHSFRV